MAVHESIEGGIRYNGKICDQHRKIYRLVQKFMPDCEEKNRAIEHLRNAFDMGIRMSEKLQWYKENRS